MTVTRKLEFALPGLSLEAGLSKVRQVVRDGPQLEAFKESNGEAVVFTGKATFYKKRFPNYSQRCNLTIAVHSAPEGAVNVAMTLESPPAVVADVFGLYNRFLRQVQAEIVATGPVTA